MDSNEQRSVHRIIINSIRIILLLFFLFSLKGNAILMQVVSLIGLFITFIPFIFQKYFGINIPARFEIITLLFVYGILFVSEVRSFYNVWWWDILLNFFASVALGFIGLSIVFVLYRTKRLNTTPEVIAILTFCLAFSVGALWEIFEYTLDTLFGSGLQQSLFDTMEDLMVNTIGVLFVSVFGYIFIKREKFVLISTLLSSFVEKNVWRVSLESEKERQERKLRELINIGENERIELKSSFRTNLHTKEFDRRIEHAMLKTITAFLNTKGGELLIGVSDGGHILGLEDDNFQNNDKMMLHLTNLLKTHIGNEFLPFIKTEIIEFDEKKVLLITCKESKNRVFLKIGGEEEFYVRNGPSSVKLEGSSLVDYIRHKFGEKE